MSEEKAKRLIVASTVGAVLLAVILVMVLVYQLIAMSVYNKRIERYDQAIAEYERLVDEAGEIEEIYKKRLWIESEARKLGLVYPDKAN